MYVFVFVFFFVFVSPVRSWVIIEDQDDVIGRLLQLFPRLLAVSQRVDELLVRIFVIRVCEGVLLLSLFSSHIQCTYYTCPMYILFTSNVCIMHIRCLYNTIQCIYYTYPMHILYIREIISALDCSSIWTDPHCRYSMAISLLSNAPFISTTYLKVLRHSNAQCNDLMIMIMLVILIIMMTMMILCCLSLCVSLAPGQVRDEPELCCHYHLNKHIPVTIT